MRTLTAIAALTGTLMIPVVGFFNIPAAHADSLTFPDHTVVQCAGDWEVAHRHLRAIRAEPRWPKGGPVPVLVGAYPPDSIGGPDGRGGVYSFGYSPDVIGSIDVPRPEWRTAR